MGAALPAMVHRDSCAADGEHLACHPAGGQACGDYGLMKAFDIDESEAAALIGGLIGAINAVTLVGMRRADSPDKIRDAMRHAVRTLLGAESADN
jgi:hypothetical protein